MSWIQYLYDTFPEENAVIDEIIFKAFYHYVYVNKDITGGSLFYMTYQLFEERGSFRCTWVRAAIDNHVFFVLFNQEELSLCLNS